MESQTSGCFFLLPAWIEREALRGWGLAVTCAGRTPKPHLLGSVSSSLRGGGEGITGRPCSPGCLGGSSRASGPVGGWKPYPLAGSDRPGVLSQLQGPGGRKEDRRGPLRSDSGKRGPEIRRLEP